MHLLRSLSGLRLLEVGQSIGSRGQNKERSGYDVKSRGIIDNKFEAQRHIIVEKKAWTRYSHSSRRRAVTRAAMRAGDPPLTAFKLRYNSDIVSRKAKSSGATDKVKSPLKVSCMPFVAPPPRQNACHTLYGFHIRGWLWSGCGLRRFG